MPACQGDAYFEAGRGTTPTLMRRIEMPTQCYTFTDLKLRKPSRGDSASRMREICTTLVQGRSRDGWWIIFPFRVVVKSLDGGKERGPSRAFLLASLPPSVSQQDAKIARPAAKSELNTIIHFECSHNDDNGMPSIRPAAVQRACQPASPHAALSRPRKETTPRKFAPLPNGGSSSCGCDLPP